MNFYAHSLENHPPENWETMAQHEQAVATRCAQFLKRIHPDLERRCALIHVERWWAENRCEVNSKQKNATNGKSAGIQSRKELLNCLERESARGVGDR